MAKAQEKYNGLVKEIQKVLLDNADFLRHLVQENLQKILYIGPHKSETTIKWRTKCLLYEISVGNLAFW